MVWLYMAHGGEFELYDYRWAIVYRHADAWIGVRALFSDTHADAIDRVPVEMELAKQAVEQIKPIVEEYLKQQPEEGDNESN